SGCASCAPSSTSSAATATSGAEAPPRAPALTGPSRMGHIGILGGTFNPPHMGHLVMAQEALDQLGLDRVVFMPVAMPPHKEAREDPGAEARVELCRLAVRGDEC